MTAGTGLALHGDDERALARLMARAQIIAKTPGLKKEIQGNPDAVAGVMLSLEGYGLPVTLQGINDAFDWIEGKAVLTAQTYQALARANGYEIIPIERTAERAVAQVAKHGRPPVTIEFSVDDAERAHRLDEWVERWVKVRGDDGRDRNRLERFVIGSNGRRRRVVLDGEETVVEFPDWVKEKIRAGEVKRYDAWWSYRTDMLWKAAAKRAVKLACSHVLLGVADTDDAADDTVWEPPVDDQVVDAEIVDVVDVSGRIDDDVVDAEVVEPVHGQEGPAPAEEPPAMFDPDDPERPF